MADEQLFTIEEEEERERVLTFMESMYGMTPPSLRVLEKEARRTGVPIIRPQTRQVLTMLLEITRPKNILEIGSATGFSASVMRLAAPEAYITGIELDEERFAKASALFASDPKTQMIHGDASDVLERLEGPYDFIFLDAAKGQYIRLLPRIRQLLSEDGILAADNCLKDGEVTCSRFAVTRRNRTIHERMRAFLGALRDDEAFTVVLLQEGVGMCVCRKRRENPENT